MKELVIVLVAWLIFAVVGFYVWEDFFSHGTPIIRIIGIPVSFIAGLCSAVLFMKIGLGSESDEEEQEAEKQRLKEQAIQEEAEKEAKERRIEEIEAELKWAESRLNGSRHCPRCRSINKALTYTTLPDDMAAALKDANLPFIVTNAVSERVVCLDCKEPCPVSIIVSSQQQAKFVLVASCEGKNPLTPHPEYRKWLSQQFGMDISFVLPEVDLSRLRSGDIVAGSLDVPEMAEIAACGCYYFHIAWDTPPPSNCRDITRDHIENGNPIVNQFYVKRLSDRAK